MRVVSARRVGGVVATLAALLALCMLIGLAAGPSAVGPARALAVLFGADADAAVADIV